MKPAYSVMTPPLVSGSDPVRVVQITDCHLGDNPGEQLVGMDTDNSLDHVIDTIVREQSEASLLLATGDLSNDGGSSAYRRLDDKLKRTKIPCAWLVGNHDSRTSIVDAVGEERLPRVINLDEWGIFMLNSAVPGEVGGGLGGDELEFVAQALATSNAENLLICLHHQPVEIGCSWLDQQRVSDADRLFDILQGDARLRAVSWGHVHQEFVSTDARLPGVQLLASPSTCIQFAPRSDDFKIDALAPGYRWFDLGRDGTLVTGVSRVSDVEFEIDLDSSGY